MATQPQKRCLYEVLGVPRDCSQEEIRSAYRRLALQLHPDKVAASGAADAASASATATAAFQELLHAYEILSDPKERAWYDSRRSQILFSDPSASKGHKPSAFVDLYLFDFFSNSTFSGYSDNGKGFYKVYGDLFAKVYGRETWFAKQMDLGASAVAPAPLIGNLDSPYSQVTTFYNYWLGFSTVMDFGWVDEYDSSMGPNRRSRRAMEEANKKLRKKARREYNDTLRGLAAFAKKRDKRVVDMMIKKNLERKKRGGQKRRQGRRKMKGGRWRGQSCTKSLSGQKLMWRRRFLLVLKMRMIKRKKLAKSSIVWRAIKNLNQTNSGRTVSNQRSTRIKLQN